MNTYDIRRVEGEFGVYLAGSDELIIVCGTLPGALGWIERKKRYELYLEKCKRDYPGGSLST